MSFRFLGSPHCVNASYNLARVYVTSHPTSPEISSRHPLHPLILETNLGSVIYRIGAASGIKYNLSQPAAIKTSALLIQVWFWLSDSVEGWSGLMQGKRTLCAHFPVNGTIWMWMSSFILTLLGSYYTEWEKFGAMLHHNSSKNSMQKTFNMQLLCQTVGRNGFSLLRALWQVHCGRTDSYIGGKWIVITCLFLMTLGWVPTDLLQEFRIGLSPPLWLQPTLQISEGKI